MVLAQADTCRLTASCAAWQCPLQAMHQHLQHLELFKRQLRSGGGGAAGANGQQVPADERRQRPPLLFPMQINLVAEEPALRFEHHPMEVRRQQLRPQPVPAALCKGSMEGEALLLTSWHCAFCCLYDPCLSVQAWMASRGPLLQQLAVQQHLWGEVAAAVQVCGLCLCCSLAHMRQLPVPVKHTLLCLKALLACPPSHCCSLTAARRHRQPAARRHGGERV